MTTKENQHQSSHTTWVENLLHEYQQLEKLPQPEANHSLYERCYAAAERGAALAKMSAERPYLGALRGCSLVDYLEAIATRAGVVLAPIFQAYGIAGSRPQDSDSIGGLARIARLIGVPVEDSLNGVRHLFDFSKPVALSRDLSNPRTEPTNLGTARHDVSPDKALEAVRLVYEEPQP